MALFVNSNQVATQAVNNVEEERYSYEKIVGLEKEKSR